MVLLRGLVRRDVLALLRLVGPLGGATALALAVLGLGLLLGLLVLLLDFRLRDLVIVVLLLLAAAAGAKTRRLEGVLLDGGGTRESWAVPGDILGRHVGGWCRLLLW